MNSWPAPLMTVRGTRLDTVHGLLISHSEMLLRCFVYVLERIVLKGLTFGL